LITTTIDEENSNGKASLIPKTSISFYLILDGLLFGHEFFGKVEEGTVLEFVDTMSYSIKGVCRSGPLSSKMSRVIPKIPLSRLIFEARV
jgi:hypothetical protein